MHPSLRIFAFATVAFLARGEAQTPPTPRLLEKHNGNSTSLTVEGQLAPTRSLDCIDVDRVEPTYTPPDLHTALRRCIATGDYDRAAHLLALAGLFARFDAERVKDVSVRDTAQVLILQTSQALTGEQRAALQKALNPLIVDGAERAAFCRSVARLALPDYFPTYMILHGAMAAANLANGERAWSDDPLVPGFDAAATWAALPHNYLHCT